MSIVFEIYNEAGEPYILDPTGGVLVDSPIILIDDDDRTIKEKIFAFAGNKLYVNFTKIRRDTNTPKPKLFVSNILNSIKEDGVDYASIYYNMDASNDVLSNLFILYRDKGFDNLTIEDMKIVVKYVTFDDIVETNDSQAIDSFNKEDLKEFFSIVRKKHELMLEKYKYLTQPDSLIGRFYKEIAQRDTATTITLSPNFTNIIYQIRGNNVTNGSRGRFIRLEAIFNAFPLTDSIPMIAIGGGSANPMIKVHNNLLRNVNEREFRSWILSERKKSNIVSFKKIKGLLIKVWNGDNMDYLTFHLSENGEIVGRFSSKEGEGDETRISNNVFSHIEGIIRTFNSMEGVFMRSKRIEPLSNSLKKVTSVSAKVDLPMYINRDALRVACYNNDVKTVFSAKQTKSDEILSLYYKPRSNYSADDTTPLSVSIADHKLIENSSTITVYNAENTQNITVIMRQLEALVFVTESFGTRKSKVKGVSEIKELRKAGADIQSTKCQKPRQPIISDTTSPLPQSYVIKMNGKQFVCPKKEYPFPGFTNENIVCCFKKDQRSRDAYVRNMNTAEAEIMVQPSNYSVSVTDTSNGLDFQTYVIKVVSDYVDGFDESNAMSRYYYISDKNTLVPLTNANLLREIELIENDEEREIWLDIVPLTRLINEPPKNKCNFPPNMASKRNNDIHSPCAHHLKNKIFGYNLHSYPCCFDRERETFTSKTNTSFDITKQHIYKTDKTLDFQRVGVLPPPLNKLFNESEALKPNKGEYFRVGVVQNVSAFLNAVLLALNNKIDGTNVNNSFELKKIIINRLAQQPDEFSTLNNGLLMEKYSTLDNFGATLLNTSVKVYWQDVIDIIQRLTGTNIYILDIPYKTTELTRTLDYANMRLVCQTYGFAGKENRDTNIVLLKKDWSYEVIVNIFTGKENVREESKATENNRVDYTFSNLHPLIKFMEKYYSVTCIKEDVYPDGFAYDSLLSFEQVAERLNNTPHQIVSQVVGGNKVYYALSKSNVLVPVKERGIIDGVEKRLISPKETLESFKKSIKALKKFGIHMSIRGLSVVDDKVNAVLTNFGQFVPVKPSEVSVTPDYPILPYKYYDILIHGQSSNQLNDVQLWSAEIRRIKEAVYRAKVMLGRHFSTNKDEQDDIISFIDKTNSSRAFKINELSKSIVQALTELMSSKDEDIEENIQFISRHIATEIVNDNIENLLLNNVVTSDLYDPTKITKRENESVLFNLSELRKWIKTYKENDSH